MCRQLPPVALWHHVDRAPSQSDFRLEPELVSRAGRASRLIGLGLLLMRAVWLVARPRLRRNVYMGWGVSLYLLGFALASQVAAARGLEAHVDSAARMSPLPRSAGPAFSGAQLVDRLRLPAGALRRRAVARPRARCSPRSGIISDDDRDALIERGLDAVASRARRTAVRGPARTTRTSTWPSSGGSPRSSAPVGGKLHTARSRNDQVATDVAMFTRAHALEARELLAAPAWRRSCELAERHLDWPMPGYTHLQRAQPVYLSHHLLAYFWMFRRDAQRFEFVLADHGRAAARRGRAGGRELRHRPRCSWPTSSASRGVAPNSIDAVSNRDFVLDFLSAAATCATHLSRLGAEIVLWSSEEFGFCEVSDALRVGLQSIMPQKKNPDAAELLRAKAPRRRRRT